VNPTPWLLGLLDVCEGDLRAVEELRDPRLVIVRESIASLKESIETTLDALDRQGTLS
jgi:hypothetical protein